MSDAQGPTKECDLVMKGGVTSGIVYPPIILKLKDCYRFRCIGGASAGAIAAAITAAAEYGRADQGFERLAEVTETLKQPGFLEGLFAPQSSLRGLLAGALELGKTLTRPASRSGLAARVGLGARLLRNHWPVDVWKGRGLGLLAGTALGLLLAGLVALLGPAPSVVATLALCATLALPAVWGGGLLNGLLAVGRDVGSLPGNNFGLCLGLRDGTAAAADQAVLTEWIHETIERVAGRAGRGGALTFGHLEEREIRLRLVTSNLSHRRPYLLPFEEHVFVFNKEEWARLFPAPVVRQLIDDSHKTHRIELPRGYHFLPAPERLPVLVAVRMTLSFPFLLGAVPLYTVSEAAFARRRRDEPLVVAAPGPGSAGDLQRNWFSDGGISSNFPIHFFDAWLPSRPTFGITLTELPKEAFESPGRVRSTFASVTKEPKPATDGGSEESAEDDPSGVEEEAVFLPKANAPQRPAWAPITGLVDFVWGILFTALEHRDTTQSMLPSYRERIVQVRLADDEGGLNLAMGKEALESVMAKGAQAGLVLHDRFDFDHHLWVRFRVLMDQLEQHLGEMDECLADVDSKRILDRQRPIDEGGEGFPYSKGGAFPDHARTRIEALRTAARALKEKIFEQGHPKPRPTLRVTPRV